MACLTVAVGWSGPALVARLTTCGPQSRQSQHSLAIRNNLSSDVPPAPSRIIVGRNTRYNRYSDPRSWAHAGQAELRTHCRVVPHQRPRRPQKPASGTGTASDSGQPSSSRAAANAAAAAARSSRVCAADSCVLILALPTGTTG